MTKPFRKKIGFVESIGGSAGDDAANKVDELAFPVDLSMGPLQNAAVANA